MSKKKLKLTITTPLRTVYENDIDQLTVTTSAGELTVLPDHVPLVVPLMVGQAMVKNDDKEIYHAIDGGILEVRHNNKVVILSDRSENSTEIDLERAETALKRAEALMNEELPMNETEYAALQKSMAKELNRVKIASRRGQRK